MPTPSIRVTNAADARFLGEWQRSDRLSRPHSRRSVLAGPVLLLVGLALVVSGVLVPGPRWLLAPLLGLPGLCLILLGSLRCYAALFRLKVGPLLVHRFSDGFVMERVHGPLRPVAFTELRHARLIDYAGQDGDMVLLVLTHDDGTVWAWTAPAPADAVVELGHATDATREHLPAFEVAAILQRIRPWTGRRMPW